MKRNRKTGAAGPVPLAPQAPNEVWCQDFCFNACLNGTKLKTLAIVDVFTRECLALEAPTSFKSIRVKGAPSERCETRTAPAFLGGDNGSEFISRSLAVFISPSGTESRFIKPGSSWENGHAESFVSRLREEQLDVQGFYNLADAQVKRRLFKRYSSDARPHSSLGYRTPAEAMSSSKRDYS